MLNLSDPRHENTRKNLDRRISLLVNGYRYWDHSRPRICSVQRGKIILENRNGLAFRTLERMTQIFLAQAITSKGKRMVGRWWTIPFINLA
jgi:hypothetical protein